MEKPMARWTEGAKISLLGFCGSLMMLWLPVAGRAQVNSGSDGHDGVLNLATNTVIDMADHLDGIYHYTSVNISNGVTVTFIPNAKNPPVVWLVRSNAVINGTVDVSANGSTGGPGGFGGGSPGPGVSNGRGPGGGMAAAGGKFGGNGSYATAGNNYYNQQSSAGVTYGNKFLVPLIGGSGGGGGGISGSGGGGAILIAADRSISINGAILATGGPYVGYYGAGSGSGGAIRLVAPKIEGQGMVSSWHGGNGQLDGGDGYVRFDVLDAAFTGSIRGAFSQGFQPILFPTSGQTAQLAVVSVGGVSLPASPTGVLATPDAVFSAQQSMPVPVVVRCSNLPLNTPITVSVKPMNGSPISVLGYNTTGTLASSTATVLVSMPRGGGLVYATAATSN